MGLTRLYLAVAVVVAHNGYHSPFVSGLFSVEMFFIISGLFMALVLNEKYTESNPARFYVARYMRLWPTYIIVLLCVFAFMGPWRDVTSSGLLTSTWFYFTASSLIGFESLWWVTQPGAKGVSVITQYGNTNYASQLTYMQHMWSVGIELVFYAIAPFFVRSARLCIAMLAVALWFHITTVTLMEYSAPLRSKTAINYLWLFMLGACVYWAWVRLRPAIDRTPSHFIAPFVALGAAMSCVYMQRTGVFPGPLSRDVPLVIFAATLIPIFHFTKDIGWDRALGELSYPLYVVHWPLVRYVYTDGRGELMATIWIVTVSIAAAIVLHLLVERPVDRWRSRLSRTKPERLSAPATQSSSA